MLNKLFSLLSGAGRLDALASMCSHLHEVITHIEDNIASKADPTLKNDAIDACIQILLEMKDKK